MTSRTARCSLALAVACWALLGSFGCDLQPLVGSFSASGDMTDAVTEEIVQPGAQSQLLTVDAGPDLTVASGAVVVLRGKGTHPADDVGRLSFAWTAVGSQTSKHIPRQRVVVGQKLIFRAPAGPTMLTFCFCVEDMAGQVASDTCVVNVLSPGLTPPAPPSPTVVVSGMSGWLEAGSMPLLEDLSADFMGAGVDSSTDLLEVISGPGAVPGVYGIVGVSTSQLDLDAPAGQSTTAEVSYRVLRP